MLKMQFKSIAWVMLFTMFYTIPHAGDTQTTLTANHNEAVPLSTALKKISDLFNTQFVYEKSLLEGKTTLYKEDAVKGKPVEEVLKNILYTWGPKISNGSDKHLKKFFNTGTNYINAVSVSNGNDLAQFYLSYAKVVPCQG